MARLRLFSDWMLDARLTRSPWLVVGKGPTFTNHSLAPAAYRKIALNHVCRHLAYDAVHVTDLDVVEVCAAFLEAGDGVLVMPYYPHVDFRPRRDRSLDALLRRGGPTSVLLNRVAGEGRLCYYRSSRSAAWPHPIDGLPSIRVRHFSAVAAVNLLVDCGVRTIRTAGVDGGSSYAEAFGDLKPLTNGRTSFDVQFAEIGRTVRRRQVDFGPLDVRADHHGVSA